jgi:hypothetical protein
MAETPINLIHIKLANLDPQMLTSPDGKRVQVSLEAIQKLLDRPFYPLSSVAP